MELSPEIVSEITRQVAEKLGVQAGLDELASAVREIIRRLQVSSEANAESDNKVKPNEIHISKKLIINALGMPKNGLIDRLKSYVAGKALIITVVSSTDIDTFNSLIMIIDYSDYQADLTQLKFEFDRICTSAGYKAIIQDSGYYKPY